MTKNQLREAIRAIIRKELAESTTTKPATPTTKPGTKTPPKIGKPGIKTKPKATMEEAIKIKDIVTRYKNLKKNG